MEEDSRREITEVPLSRITEVDVCDQTATLSLMVSTRCIATISIPLWFRMWSQTRVRLYTDRIHQTVQILRFRVFLPKDRDEVCITCHKKSVLNVLGNKEKKLY